MATSMFWNTMGVGDGPSSGYGPADIARWVRAVFGEGILAGAWDELAVSGAASPLSVAAGAALVDGHPYLNPTPLAIAVATPGAGVTGGRIVLRADWSAQTVLAVAKLNTDGISTPPTLAHTSETLYEISLATFTVTTGGVVGDLVVEPGRVAFPMQLRPDRASLAALSIIGRTGSSGGIGQAIAADADGQILRRVSGVLGFGQALTASFVDDAVTAGKIAGGAIVAGKLATAVVETEKIAAEAVSDAEVGARVSKYSNRRGGSSTSWVTPGTSNYTLGKIRVQVGVVRIPFASGAAGASAAITFPEPFVGSAPLIRLTIEDNGLYYTNQPGVFIDAPSTIGATIRAYRKTGTASGYVDVAWKAIGPR